MANEKTSGAGGSSGRRGEGRGGPFGERGRGPGGPGGRGPGGPRGRGDRRGRDERRGDSGGGSHRILTELPALEKALSAGDPSKQKASLEQILKALRPMRLKGLDDLDANTRGRLLTTLVRVQRQPRPAHFEQLVAEKPPVESPTADAEAAPPATGSAAEAAPPETAVDGPPAEAASESGEPDSGVAAAETVEHAAEAAPPSAASEETPAAAAAPDSSEIAKARGYQEVLFVTGQVWRAAGEGERARAAFELSGRPPPQRDPSVESEPVSEEKSARPPREKRERRDRPERGERGGRPPPAAASAVPTEGRRERGAKSARRATEPVNLPIGGNWQEVAADYERQGRTRDAARVHERNQSWAEAARLFDAGGNPREALRCAIAARDTEGARRLARSMPMDQARPVLEKANAFELLMELYVHAQDFENVAKLYERARQFDQAGLAWERGGKFAAARKAYERARDFKAATRMRNMEVDKLVERGDRLGAAQILVQAGRKQEAVATLLALPPFKAYKFLERLKLEDAAKALAGRELVKATEEKKPASRARWLELLDDNGPAAEAWAEASRPDRASVCNEKAGNLRLAAEQAEAVQDYDRAQDLYRRAGDTASMERVAALPRVPLEERKRRHPPMHEDEHEHEDEHPDGKGEAGGAAPDARSDG